MEHRIKFNLKFILKSIVVLIISIKTLTVLYGLSFEPYFAKQAQTESHTAFLDELKYAYPNISVAIFERGNLEITIEVSQKVKPKAFKESVTEFICERFTQREAVLNINLRYSNHFNYPESGKLLASWLLFAKNCT